MRLLRSSVLVGVMLCALVSGSAHAREPRPIVHQVTASAQGLSVNGYIIEGAHGLVVVDSALTVSDGRALRARVDALGKPLLAVLLTHGHPDHYNGVFYLLEGRAERTPVYATRAVARIIREYDAAKQVQWQPVFGSEWPEQRTFVDHELTDGEQLTFDGMHFLVHDLGPSESHADSYWELLGPARAAFIGDQVLNGSHAYTNDGHTSEWLHHLDALSRALRSVPRLFPGHGAAGDASILAWQKRYLLEYRRQVDALRQGRSKLSDAEKQTLVERMRAAYPRATNDFMIALGADTVAAELAAQHAGGAR